MGGKQPMTVLTDQCRAMEVAIAEVWPGTRHRWCKWHVLKRVGECVPLYNASLDFRDRFHKMLNEMLTVEEFVSEWTSLLSECGLSKNTFLEQIFATKEMWAKCYFKEVFCARMTSMQRSESANMMLKNIVPANSTLHKFVEQYDKLQYIRDEEEDFQEKRAKMKPRREGAGGPLMAHASEVYTPNVHKLFGVIKDKSEYYRSFELVPGLVYEAKHYHLESVQRWCKGRYMVTVRDGGAMYDCECGLFEHFGVPCRHIVRVLISRGVQKLPEGLIVKRWTKKARLVLPGHMQHLNRVDPDLRSQTYRHTSIMISLLEFAELADKNIDTYKLGMQLLQDGKSAMSDGLELADRATASMAAAAVDPADPFSLRVPRSRREPGRPTNKRAQAGHEGCSKWPRFCSVCKSEKHNKLKCPDYVPAADNGRKESTCSKCGLEGHISTMCGQGGAGVTLALREFI